MSRVTPDPRGLPHPTPFSPGPQLWNLNGYGGVVGVFNIQGSAWSIAHRSFVMHNAAPPALAARVAPSDVAGLAPAAAYAVYRDATQVCG